MNAALNSTLNTPVFVWLIVLPLLGAPLTYLAGRDIRRNTQAALALLLGMWVLFVLAVGETQSNFTFGAINLHFDGVSLLLAALILILGTLVVLYSRVYLHDETGQEKFFALLMLMLGALLGLSCAVDLFNLWLWFEVLTVSAYLLTAFHRHRAASLEAGLKYLVQSAAGSALALIGIALVLWQAGSLDLTRIADQLARQAQGSADAFGSPMWMIVAGALVVVGLGVKAALVPMHTWLPDAHSQAPSGISAMLSGIVIEAGLVALLRALAVLGIPWGGLLMGLGALNMLVGNLLALRQTEVKRLLAYSSIAQVGYMLLGIGIAIYSGQAGGAQGGLFHVLTHGLMKGLAFLAAGAFLYALQLRATLTVDDLSGAAQRYPVVALTLSLAVLGLGGLPPLAGFMSKWQIFASGAATRDSLIDGLVIFAALNSVLSLAYYAPLVNRVYRHHPSSSVMAGKPIPLLMSVPLAVLAVAIVAIGIWPDLLSWLTQPAGAALTAAFMR